MSGHMSGCYQINEGSMASTSELQKAGLLGSNFAMEPRKGKAIGYAVGTIRAI